MYQKDYILRMIEMIGDLIALILGLVKKGDEEQAAKILERGYIDLLRQDSAFFLQIPKEKLTNQLVEEHNYEKVHLEVLAELFFAEATLAEVQNRKEFCLECYEKSLILTEFLESEDKTWSKKREERKDLLVQKIQNLNRNPQGPYNLEGYHNLEGT
jgi:hypothetical protein